MADPRSLPSAERSSAEFDYKPVSGVAVAAVVVAGTYVAIVLLMVVFALNSNRPTMNVYPLLLAGLGLVLAIAGRLHIRRSEQTRTGMKCVNVAWWMSVLGGVAFGAYIVANVLAVREQSDKAAMGWFDLLKKHEVERAYLLTVAPPLRPEKTADIEARFGGQLEWFRDSELVRFFKRNGDDIEIKSIGMSNLDQIENGYRIDLAYQIKSPEGLFGVNLALQGTETTKTVGRDWQIGMIQVPPKTAEDGDGTLTVKKMTPYGWLVRDLQEEAFRTAQEWLAAVQSNLAEDALVATFPATERPALVAQLLTRRIGAPFPAFLLSPLTSAKLEVIAGDDTFDILFKRAFFKVEGPDAGTEDKKKKLRAVWTNGDFALAGTRRLQWPEKLPQLSIASDALTFTVPLEVRLPPLSPPAYAFARIILAADSPELVKEVNQLKEKAKSNPEYLDKRPASLLSSLPPRNWRILRLETNLEPLQAAARPAEQR